MKKNLFYLFALICSMSLFTACSDDDEDNGWKNLPQGEITADKIDLKLNGENATGKVSFKATSSQAAQVGLTNVIDGYSDIAVDVILEKQADDSYTFTGTKDITTKPVTKAVNTPAPFLKVTVSGTVFSDGKATMNIAATGVGLYIGTYSGETLVLKYGDTVLAGKEVILDATDGDNASILLTSVIPGENQTTLTGLQLSNGTFSGSTKTTYATVAYSGSHSDKVLTLTLDVTMNDPNSWAKSYGIGEYTLGKLPIEDASEVVMSGAGYVNFVVTDDDYNVGSTYGALFRGAFGMLLPQVLQSVTLGTDGNVTASYHSGAIQFNAENLFSPISADELAKLIPTSDWLNSPKDLAYWFEKDGKLYVKLNIASILSQVMGSDASSISGILNQILQSDPAAIKSLIAGLLGGALPAEQAETLGLYISNVSDDTISMLLSWLNEGFPLNVMNENGHTYIYLDKSAFDSLFISHPVTGITGVWGNPVDEDFDLSLIIGGLSKTGLLPEEVGMASMLLMMINQSWENTTSFDLGLDLMAK